MPADDRPMRIALIAPSLRGGGLERATADLARQLLERGLRPQVFTLDGLGVFADSLAIAGVPVCDVAAGNPRRFTFMSHLARALASFGPDVIHAHSGTWYATAVAGIRMPAVPIVYTEHGRYPPEPWHRLAIDRWCARRTSRITAVSGETARYLARVLKLVDVPAVIENGIDLSAYRVADGVRREARASLGLQDENCAAISVARFAPVKDHATLLRATAQVVASEPRFVLLLLGSGELETDLRQLAEALGIGSSVRFLGFRTDVARCLAASDLFTISSSTEGLPISLLEALATGLPTVATDVGGIPAALGSPPAGILVPPGDPSAFASALLSLTVDASERRRLGSLALQRSAEYSLASSADRYISLYESLSGVGSD